MTAVAMAIPQQRALAELVLRLEIALSTSGLLAARAAYRGCATDEQLVELASIPAVGAFLHAVREIAP